MKHNYGVSGKTIILSHAIKIVGEDSEYGIVVKSSCICPGHMWTLECTMVGSPFGATVWQGDFFDCSNGIILLHNSERYTVGKQECNDGSIVGQGIAIDGNHYTSQLNITINDYIDDQTIQCYSDLEERILVDSVTINTTGAHY